MVNLIQAKQTDLTINSPLAWDLYDQEHNLLLKKGHSFKTIDEIKTLLNKTIFFNNPGAVEKHDKPLNGVRVDFENMHLRVGSRLQLKMQSNKQASCCCSNNNGSCVVNLIGYILDKTLMISMPKNNQLVGHPLLEGDKLLVRTFSRQFAYSFSTYVENIIKLPYQLVHLSFPKQIEAYQIRKSQRVKCNIQATINGHSEAKTITNISSTGALITSPDDLKLEVGQSLEISFSLQFEEKDVPFKLTSVVKSFDTRISNQGISYCYGIEFTDLEADQAFALRSFTYYEMANDPASCI